MTVRIVVRLTGEDAEVGGVTPAVHAALRRLRGDGVDERELATDVIAAEGAAGLTVLYVALQQLANRDALSWSVEGDGGVLVTVLGRAPLVKLHREPPHADARLLLSRFAILRRDGETLLLESGLSAACIVVHDARVTALLTMLVTPRPLADLAAVLPEHDAAVLLSLLADCGMLASADGEGRMAEDQGSLAYWTPSDLLFHARSRIGRHHGAYGGTYRFRGRTEPLPALKPPMSSESFELPVPDLDALRRQDVPFTAVLEDRHSTRSFGERPLGRRTLGEFLYRTARQKRTFDDARGQELSSRPYPGGGALYELEIYIAARGFADLPAGLYHYAAGEHRLHRLPARPDIVDVLLRQAALLSQHEPQVLLTITARFARVFWKYEGMGYALVLKDAGVLVQTMYLVAQAMGLGATALGGGDADLFSAAIGSDYYAETSVAEFLLGTKG